MKKPKNAKRVIKKKTARKPRGFRLPAEIVDRLTQDSKKAGRSLEQEILFRISQALNFEVAFKDVDRLRAENDLLIKLGREAALMHWRIRPVAGRPGWYFKGDNPPKELVEINPALYEIIEAVVDRKLQKP